jgi:hypothetical protein
MKTFKCKRRLDLDSNPSTYVIELDNDFIYNLSLENVHIKGSKTKILKPGVKYEILAYKIKKNRDHGRFYILYGHNDGANDRVVTSIMDKFIKHKDYFLYEIVIRKARNQN